MKFVGYGAMLAEAFVALIALVTIMILPQEAARGVSPGTMGLSPDSWSMPTLGIP
jgi:carbon starvation protein CstA